MKTRVAALPKAQKVDPFRIGHRLLQRGNETIEIPLTEADFLHPQEEDRFLLTDAHSRAVAYLRHAIEFAHRGETGVRVFIDHRVDWQTGNVLPMGPDVIAFGKFLAEWDPYVGTLPVANLGVEPWLVAEVTSPSTRHIDVGIKPDLYHLARVPFFLIFDLCPTDREEPQLLAFRATRKGYVEMKENPEYGIWVPTVEMWFKFDGDRVVAHTAKKEEIPDYDVLAQRLDEQTVRADSEQARADLEKARADQLAKELAELRAKHTNPPTKKNGHK